MNNRKGTLQSTMEYMEGRGKELNQSASRKAQKTSPPSQAQRQSSLIQKAMEESSKPLTYAFTTGGARKAESASNGSLNQLLKEEFAALKMSRESLTNSQKGSSDNKDQYRDKANASWGREPMEDQNKSNSWNHQGRLIEAALQNQQRASSWNHQARLIEAAVHNQQRASLPWALLGLQQEEEIADDHLMDVNAAFRKTKQRQEPTEDQSKLNSSNQQARLIESALHNQQRASLPWALLGLQQQEETADECIMDVNAAFRKVRQVQKVREDEFLRSERDSSAKYDFSEAFDDSSIEEESYEQTLMHLTV